MAEPDDWDCEAYGPEGREFGALCFLAGELHVRVCDSQGECHTVMYAARQNVFRKIQENAAAGNPTAAYLAEQFTDPSQLLGGAEDG